MKKLFDIIADDLADGLILAFTILFPGYVALTQSAALAAPTMALFTAILWSPGIGSAGTTIAGQLRRPFAGIGTTLTAFLWLLSTTQPKVEVMPGTVVEALIIFVGLAVATSVIFASPILYASARIRASRGRVASKNQRVSDFGLGMVSATAAFLLVWFMLKLSEGLVGPLENEWALFVICLVGSPIIGWLIAFDERRRTNGGGASGD